MKINWIKLYEISVYPVLIVLLIQAAVPVVTSMNSESDCISDAELILRISSAAYESGAGIAACLLFLLVTFYVLWEDEADDSISDTTAHSNNHENSLLKSSTDEKGTVMNRFIGFTSIGPRASQQDAFEIYSSDNLKTGLVCDGVCGHLGGEHASQTAAQIIAESAEQWSQTDSSDDLIDQMKKAVELAHLSIKKDAALKSEYQGMATTLAMACVRKNIAHLLWVGDSRIYLFRDGQLKCLSQDHSIVNQMVIDGLLDKQQARCHPENNVITRALGSDCGEPDGGILSLQPGDGLLLVSDGVMDGLDDDGICSVLTCLHKRNADDEIVAETVVQAAINAGTNDNTTAVWYRHPAAKQEIATKFRQVKMAQVVCDSFKSLSLRKSSAAKPPKDSSKYQLEVIDAQGRSRESLLNKSVRIGRLPQSDVCIDYDPYLDASQIKLEPTAEGVKISNLSSRVDSFIKLGNDPVVHKPPFDLLVGSTLLQIRSIDTERQV